MVAVVPLHLNYTLKQTLILLSVFVVKGAKRVLFSRVWWITCKSNLVSLKMLYLKILVCHY